MNKIEKLSNNQLIESYTDAVKDSHYNPSGCTYNNSGFSESELKYEILLRMNWESYETDN